MNQVGGYFILPRNELKNLKKPLSKFEAWLFLVSEASYESQSIVIRNQVYLLEPGDVVRSLRSLSEDYGWSLNKTQRFISDLISQGKLEKKVSTQTDTLSSTLLVHKVGHLTICNYESYTGKQYTNDSKTNTEPSTQTNNVVIKGKKIKKERDFLSKKFLATKSKYDY